MSGVPETTSDSTGATTSDPKGFDGIPADALDFYDDLAVENSRAWWLAHKDRYTASVRRPLEALLDALEDEFGPAHVFRPNRDVRFSADKSPYKDHQGALATTVPGMGFYVQVAAEGLMTGGGFYPTGSDQLPRLRAAIDAPVSGQALQRITDGLAADGFELGGDRVATRPRGVAADHPRLELMRFKNLVAARRHGAPAWLSTPEAVEHVRADWRAVRPLVEWLTEHVGATAQPRGR
ncbi:DUF2461 domain-containing protein [Fodinibacter luteus]|uniref:DUF2461 domain-containing protein n=1 Tax=Fodinibacter luteus TaxID=552064 RepID=UPI0031E5BDCF